MRHCGLLLVAALLCAAGCAPHARVLTLCPAELPLGDIRTLAIVDRSPEPNLGVASRAALAAELAQSPQLTLVDSAEPSAVAQAAYSSGIAVPPPADAVLTVHAIAESSPADSWLPKQSRIALNFELTDTRTGTILASQETLHTLSGRPAEKPADQVQAELLRRCARDVAMLIATQQVPQEVTLARQYWGNGQSAVARGNKLAQSGDWEGAVAAWNEALVHNPRSHAALHNLAVAAEARGDLPAARQLVDRAINVFAAKLYHHTRSRLAR